MGIFGLWTFGSDENYKCRFSWRGIGLLYVLGRGFHGPRQNVILSTAATATATATVSLYYSSTVRPCVKGLPSPERRFEVVGR